MRCLPVLVLPILFAACSSPAPEPAGDKAASLDTPEAVESAAAPETGYMAADVRLDPTRLLAGPPPAGTLAARADALADAEALAARGGADWVRGAKFNSVRGEPMQQSMACALGVQLSDEGTPALRRLLARTSEEMGALSNPAQRHFARTRPFGDDPAQSCDTNAANLGASYPSGQASTGWLWALALTDVRPERKSELLGFGMQAGDIRVSCRAHWLSDVNAGRSLAAALHQRLSALPAYKADVLEARREVALAPVPDCRTVPMP